MMLDAAPAPGWAAHLPAGAAFDPRDLVAKGSLAASWVARWSADPTHRVVYDDEVGWLSADELEERSRSVADRLAGLGLIAGDRVLLSGVPSARLVVAYIAAIRLGLVVVPLNSSYRQPEVAQIVHSAAPSAAIVESADLARWIGEGATSEIPVMSTDVPITHGRAVELDGARSADSALLVYTSGTTGVPKGVPLSHGNLLSSAEAVQMAWRWSPEDRLVLALPLFHLHGLGVGVNGTLCAGASVVVRPRFAGDDLLDSAASHRGTLFFGVPTMYRRLVALPRADELSGLRLCVSGSAPMPPDLFEAVGNAGGQVVLERYGMSETVMNVSNPYEGERRAGSVGLPLPGVEVRLCADTGEIQLRGPNVFAGYLGESGGAKASFSEDGWFLTGDVGRFDDDGYLRIVGRLKEVIISGGYNVYPREVEDAFRGHAAVSDIAVVGVPDADWGERVTAFVVGDHRTEGKLRALAAAALASYKRPKDFVFVDELPRNELGKVLANELVAKMSRKRID